MKGKKIRIFGGCLILAALVSFALWMLAEPPEPVYQGKPLSYWLRGSVIRFFHSGSEDIPTHDSALKALAAMGTNAIPTLLYWLKEKDSALSLQMFIVLTRHPWLKLHHEFAFERSMKAAYGLKFLGPLAKSALPELMRIYNQPTEFVGPRPLNDVLGPRFEVINVLESMGPAAEPAVPSLARAVTHDADALFRTFTAEALGVLQLRPEISVPALMACLQDPSNAVKKSAIRALGKFGAGAQVALPLLRNIAEHADPPEIGLPFDAILEMHKGVDRGSLQDEAVDAIKHIQASADRFSSPSFPN